MAEFKVREVKPEEEKSSQEIEVALIDEHKNKEGGSEEKPFKEENVIDVDGEIVKAEAETKKEEPKEEPIPETLSDDSVLSFIKEKYGKEINSLDKLFEDKKEVSLPEEVEAFLKFKKDTGRSISDFAALNRDFSALNPDDLLVEYWAATKPHLDDDDVNFELDSRFGFDTEYDDEKEVRRKKIAKKEELVKAKEYFEKHKEQYHIPLVSSGDGVPNAEKENYEAYKKMVEESKGAQDVNEKRRGYFEQETGKVFNKEFEGFKFNIEEKDFVFKPAEADKLKETQSDVNNFINSHLNEEGFIKDAATYHRSLAVAMNPDAFAKFFYEQGKSEAVKDYSKESKNIDMNIRSAPQTLSKGGFKVASVNNDHGNRLVIKSHKNK